MSTAASALNTHRLGYIDAGNNRLPIKIHVIDAATEVMRSRDYIDSS